MKFGDNELELNFRGDHLDAVANVLNERDMNLCNNS